MLTRNTVNSGLRATRYSRARLRALVCAVTDSSSASAGSTSDASPANALLRSLIDRSSRALAGLTKSKSAKTKKSPRIINLLPPVSSDITIPLSRCRESLLTCLCQAPRHSGVRRGEPLYNDCASIFFANGSGASDVFLNRRRVAGLADFACTSDGHFQRVSDCDLRVTCARR